MVDRATVAAVKIHTLNTSKPPFSLPIGKICCPNAVAAFGGKERSIWNQPGSVRDEYGVMSDHFEWLRLSRTMTEEQS